MENTDLLTNKRTLEKDPQYFGAYLNMARHNVFLINNHLAEKFEISKINNEEHIANSFFTNEIRKKPNHVFSFLTRFLPIAKVFDTDQLPKSEQDDLNSQEKTGKDITKLSKELKLCFKELNSFRNDYSHYYSTKNETNRKIIIEKDLSDFLKNNYQRAIEYSKKRFAGIFEEKHFNLAKEIELVSQDNKITEKGLVFFICLFLDRENAFKFINKIVGFKGTHLPEFKATREVFLAFCVKLPHDKFISDNPEQAFALDMLNELNRCPSILFDALPENLKTHFLPTLNKPEVQNIEENSLSEDLPEENYNDYIQSITKRIRYKDRFPYFALKFLDSTELSSKIRFQINLGKYQIDQYEKDFSGEKEKRAIVEDAKAFGRLDDFFNKEKETEKKINNKNAQNSKFEQFAPHYNYNTEQNKIGFQFYPKGINVPVYPKLKESKNTGNRTNFNLKQNLPDAFLSINELKKLVLLEILKQGKAEEIIGEFVNLNNNKIFDRNFIYEIKNELNFDNDFHRKFQGKKTFAYEKPEQTDLQNRKQKLNEILQKHNLNIKQIPSRIIDYWLKIKEVKDDLAIANRIKTMKTDCKDRLKAKKKGKAPKIGEMASFLARDIVDMVIDLDTKKKITSFYYDKMQESLALFADPEKRQIFTNICKELNLLNKEKGHPFLIDIQIQEIKNTYDFYEKYLIEKGNKVLTKWNGKKKVEKDVSWIYMNFYKLEWNEKVKKNLTVVSLPNDLSKIPLTISNLKEKEKSNFDTWLKNKKEKPIDLPVNLFDNALVDVLRKKLHEKNVAYKTNDKYFYLLKLWLGIEKLQPFYNYEREYTVYDEKINFKPGTKSKVKDYFEGRLNTIKTKEKNRRKEKNLSALQDIDVRKVLNNAITENEKVIRFTHEQDRILLLMIKNIIQSGSNLNIALDNIDTALNETVKVSQTISGKLSFFDENGKKIEKDDEKPKIEKIITDNRKRKDFSVLKKLTSDRRLPELFQYFDESEIPYPKLKVELDSYNKVKDLIFDRAFELEIALINKAKDKIITNDSKNIQHEPYLKWLQKENHINTDEFNFLKVVRNTFSHNQFPPKVIVDIFHTLDKSKPIAGQIYNIYDEKIRMLLQKMEKE